MLKLLPFFILNTLLTFAWGAAAADPSDCLQAFLRRKFDPKPSISPSHIEYNKHLLRPSQRAYSKLTPLSERELDKKEDLLKSMSIIKIEILSVASANETRLITLSDGTKAIWKPHAEQMASNYRAEVLAYEFDRLIGFDFVPVTVERKIDGIRGSVQLFMESGNPWKLPDHEFYKQSFFDFLIDNRDRHRYNYLASPEGDRIIAIDNGLSFTGLGIHGKSFFKRRKAIKRFLSSDEGSVIMQRINDLDLKALESEIKAYLGKEDARKMIRRIEIAKDYYLEILK